jgi:hypothetical protein
MYIEVEVKYGPYYPLECLRTLITITLTPIANNIINIIGKQLQIIPWVLSPLTVRGVLLGGEVDASIGVLVKF